MLSLYTCYIIALMILSCVVSIYSVMVDRIGD